MEKTDITKELPAPSWWKDWFAKRREKIKALKVSMRRRGRWGTILELRLEGDRHLLDEFKLNTFIRGDAVNLILSNMIIEDIEIGYKGRVKPFEYPEGQTRIPVQMDKCPNCGGPLGLTRDEPPLDYCKTCGAVG